MLSTQTGLGTRNALGSSYLLASVGISLNSISENYQLPSFILVLRDTLALRNCRVVLAKHVGRNPCSTHVSTGSNRSA